MSVIKQKSAFVKPRNSVFFQLTQRLLKGGAAGRHQDAQRVRQTAEKDLADRIREVGEW